MPIMDDTKILTIVASVWGRLALSLLPGVRTGGGASELSFN
jgi:hypothetical protein